MSVVFFIVFLSLYTYLGKTVLRVPRVSPPLGGLGGITKGTLGIF